MPRFYATALACAVFLGCDTSSPTEPTRYSEIEDEEDDRHDSDDDGGSDPNPPTRPQRRCVVEVVDTDTTTVSLPEYYHVRWNILFGCYGSASSHSSELALTAAIFVDGERWSTAQHRFRLAPGASRWVCQRRPCEFIGDGVLLELAIPYGKSYRWKYRFRACGPGQVCSYPAPPEN